MGAGESPPFTSQRQDGGGGRLTAYGVRFTGNGLRLALMAGEAPARRESLSAPRRPNTKESHRQPSIAAIATEPLGDTELLCSRLLSTQKDSGRFARRTSRRPSGCQRVGLGTSTGHYPASGLRVNCNLQTDAWRRPESDRRAFPTPSRLARQSAILNLQSRMPMWMAGEMPACNRLRKA